MAHPTTNLRFEDDLDGRARGAWATGRSYAVGDIVDSGGNTYIGITEQHYSSASFADDLAAGYWQLKDATVISGGGATPTPTTHGAAVANWGALPAAGSFTGEIRDVPDLTGSGRTGDGAAIWDGTSWQPLGGAVGVSLTTETFTATAGQSVFTLARAPTTPANTQLTLRGLSRDFATDYTVAGAVVTLTMPSVTVSAGDTLIVQYD